MCEPRHHSAPSRQLGNTVQSMLGIQYKVCRQFALLAGSCTFGVSVRFTFQWSGAVLWTCQIDHSQPVVRSTSISVGGVLQPQHSAQCNLAQPIAPHKQKQMARAHTSQPASTRADCIMLSPNVCRCKYELLVLGGLLNGIEPDRALPQAATSHDLFFHEPARICWSRSGAESRPGQTIWF